MLLRASSPDRVFKASKADKSVSNHIAKLGAEIENQERQIGILISQQANAPALNVKAARSMALNEIAQIGPVVFLEQDTVVLSQALHRIFGKYRIVVNEGKIAHFRIAPRPYHRV